MCARPPWLPSCGAPDARPVSTLPWRRAARPMASSELVDVANRARVAARALASLTLAQKNAALQVSALAHRRHVRTCCARSRRARGAASPHAPGDPLFIVFSIR